MKLETVLALYAEPQAQRTGCFEAILSPDGWENSAYRPENGTRLRSDEVAEFSNLVMSFFHECKTQNDLKKFCKKYGTDTDAVTSSFRFDCALMSYCVHVTGYSAVFVPYRKENV